MCVLVSFEKSVRPRGERKIWLWNLEPDYTNQAGSLYRKLGTLLKRNKNQLCDDNQASPVSWDPHIVMPGSRVEIFQVITLAGRPGESTKRKQYSMKHTVQAHCFPGSCNQAFTVSCIVTQFARESFGISHFRGSCKREYN